MRLSRIYQHHSRHDDAHAAILGARIRERRVRAGLTQTELGAPMTRSFISAVEHGRAVPSLPALTLIAARLGVSAGELLDQLEWTWQNTYSGGHERDDSPPAGDGR